MTAITQIEAGTRTINGLSAQLVEECCVPACATAEPRAFSVGECRAVGGAKWVTQAREADRCEGRGGEES